ncbi:MAG: RNA polymerase sigma-I factor [Bacillota bacterium]|nr:RNA polymerase sigma-I factor [Bacillota bacterium]
MSISKLFNLNNKVEKTMDSSENSLLSLLINIKEGDVVLRENFIIDHKPFILKAVSGVVGKFISEDNHDEFSIGMEAFNESIDKYDLDKKSSFFKFSEQVIQRRIIDYLRKNKKSGMIYPFSSINEYEAFEERYLTSDSHYRYENIEVNEEINALKVELGKYGITIADLAICSPKHDDSRRLCIKIARILANDSELFDKLKKNKSIPRNELLKKANVHRRTIENNRKYIIAVSLILNSNLEISKRLFKYAEEEIS